MGLVQLYSTPKTRGDPNASQTSSSRCHTAESSTFCRCQRDVQRKSLEKSKTKGQMNTSTEQLVRKVYLRPPRSERYRLQLQPDTCRCGEDTCRTINWTWDEQNLQPQTIVAANDHTVQFHPIYSQGKGFLVECMQKKSMSMKIKCASMKI